MNLYEIKDAKRRAMMEKLHDYIDLLKVTTVKLNSKDFEWLRDELGLPVDCHEFTYRGAVIRKIK